MRKILNTAFDVKDLTFIIRINDKRTEYEGKYKLLMYNDQICSWMRKATDDSMRYLKKYAEENALYW